MSEQKATYYLGKRKPYQRIGFALGPILALIILFLPTPEGLAMDAWRVVAMMVWLAIWWATEAIPVPATSLIPIVYLPLMGVISLKAATTPYAAPIIFLLLGGFIIAMTMQRWNLHKRIALLVLVRVGNKPANLIGGFMVASALISMWVSNTSTTLMMIPIALSVANEVVGEKTWRHPFTIALMLGIAWSSSIGGLGTPIGTPPNVMLLGYFSENLGIEINFIEWMTFAVPIVFLMVPAAWLVLTKWTFDINKGIIGDGEEAVKEQLKALGPMTVPEKRTAILFVIISLSWATRPLLNSFEPLASLTDTIIAVMGAIAMFLVPAGSTDKDVFLLDWDWAVRIPWGVILLFGGGLSMAAAITSTGLAVWLGEGLLFLTTFEMIIFIGVLVTLVIFLTELTSNTATTAALLPVMAAIATGANLDPILLAAPVAMAASCAFMFPVATAPNAIIFAGGQVTIPDMVKAGFRLNLIGVIIITTICYTLLPLVFG